jgi:hypothetical protein
MEVTIGVGTDHGGRGRTRRSLLLRMLLEDEATPSSGGDVSRPSPGSARLIDLILLDVRLPKTNGLVCGSCRPATSRSDADRP